jgi:large subunit ribosomal protein L18
MQSLTQLKREKRQRRHDRVRSIVSGSAARPRLSVFRSNTGVYAQLIDDTTHKTLVAASTKEISGKHPKTETAGLLGTLIAEKAKKHNISQVVFDRGGYQYHGRVKALAEAAREAGLQF